MKKKLLIGLLPVLMTLSACGGSSPKANEEETFLEDTEVHEELFGEAQEIKSTKKNAASLTKPTIGYQLSYADSKLAIRFVSLINEIDADVTATWKRAVAGADGTDLSTGKGFDDTLASTTKYYKKLTGWPDADPGKGYVVYSLYNIPYNATNKNAYVAAYLTLTDTASHIAKTDLLAVKIEADNVYEHSVNTFTFDPDNTGKHFLQGTINGVTGTVLSYESPQGSNDFAAYFDIDMLTTDSFGSFYYSSDVFQYFGYTNYFSTTSSDFNQSTNTGYVTPKADGRYNLYLSSKNDGEGDFRNKVYSKKTFANAHTFIWSEEGAYSGFANVIAWVWTNKDDGHWVDMTYISDKSACVALTGSVNVSLVKFSSGTTASNADWNNKLWQTEDATSSDRVVDWK